MVNNLNIRIELLKKEVSVIWNNVVKLRAKFCEKTSVPVIEKRAIEELNMKYPQEREIIKLKDIPLKR